MAYINAEGTKKIRDELKASFPNLKFSVRNDNYSSVNVSIVKGNLDFSPIDPKAKENYDGRGYQQLNHYYLEWYNNAEVLKKIREICMRGNHDNSDLQTDYFDVGWYVSINVGKWDKPYELVA